MTIRPTQKSHLGELTDVLTKHRPPKGVSQRPHLVDYPVDPTTACDAIDGFSDRVYGRGDGPSCNPPFSSTDIDDVVRNSVLRWSNKSVRGDAPKHGAPILPTTHAQHWGHPQHMTPPMTAPTLAADGHHDAANQHVHMMHGMMQMQQQQMIAMMGGCMPGMMPMFGGGFGAASGYGGGAMAGFGGGAPWQMPPRPPCAGGGYPPVGYFPGARGAFGGARPPVHRHGGRAAIGHGDGQDEDQRGPPPPGHHATLEDTADQAYANAEGDELDSVEGLLAKDKAKKATAAKAKAKAESPSVVDPKGKAKAKPLARAPVERKPAKLTSIKRPAAAATSVPHWGYEESRSQIMCRTSM